MKAMLAAVVLLAGLLGAACGGNAATTSSTAPVSSAPTIAPTLSPTPDPNATAALAAFAASVTAFDQAVRDMNPDDPKIPATTTGDQVIHELTTLHSWKIQGITAKGDLPRVVGSHIVSLTADTAELMACVYDPSVLIYATTGQPVPTNTAGQFYVDTHASLKLDMGHWKISRSTTQTETAGCLPGY